MLGQIDVIFIFQVVFWGSPVKDVCNFVISLITLFPGMSQTSLLKDLQKFRESSRIIVHSLSSISLLWWVGRHFGQAFFKNLNLKCIWLVKQIRDSGEVIVKVQGWKFSWQIGKKILNAFNENVIKIEKNFLYFYLLPINVMHHLRDISWWSPNQLIATCFLSYGCREWQHVQLIIEKTVNCENLEFVTRFSSYLNLDYLRFISPWYPFIFQKPATF